VEHRGYLTTENIEQHIHDQGLHDIAPNLARVIDDMDVSGTGQVDWTEFLAASLDPRLYTEEAACKVAFSVFDLNGDGKICIDDLQKLLNQKGDDVDGEEMDALLKLADGDQNGDGVIELEEFSHMLQCKRSFRQHSLSL